MEILLNSSVLTKSQICEILGVSRNTLRYYLKKWDIYEEYKRNRIILNKDLKVIHEKWTGEKNKDK